MAAQAATARRTKAPTLPMATEAWYKLRNWAKDDRRPVVPDADAGRVLARLAAAADPDGHNAALTLSTLGELFVPIGAEVTEAERSRARRAIKYLITHRVIAPDTVTPNERWLATPSYKRGNRYVILAPWSIWSPAEQLEVNRYRATFADRPPLDAEARPPLVRPEVKRRKDAGVPNPNRGRKATRATAPAAELVAEAAAAVAPVVEALEAAAPPSASPMTRGVFALARLLLAEVEAAGPAGVDAAVGMVKRAAAELVEAAAALACTALTGGEVIHRGVSETPPGVSANTNRGVSQTPNHSVSTTLEDREESPSPAVGARPQVVRGPSSSAASAAGVKPPRPSTTPRRDRPLWSVSADAVAVYRAALPSSITRCIPEHAVGRVLGMITAELEALGGRIAHPDDAPAELARLMAERAEAWRWRMGEARDPVAVVVGAIVRGPDSAAAALPWCGLCEGSSPNRRWWTNAEGRAVRCRRCHPAVADPAAAAELAELVDDDYETLRRVFPDDLARRLAAGPFGAAAQTG